MSYVMQLHLFLSFADFGYLAVTGSNLALESLFFVACVCRSESNEGLADVLTRLLSLSLGSTGSLTRVGTACTLISLFSSAPAHCTASREVQEVRDSTLISPQTNRTSSHANSDCDNHCVFPNPNLPTPTT